MSAPTQPSAQEFARLQDLTDGGNADLPASFANMAALLENAGFDVRIEFHILVDQSFRQFSLRVAGGKSSAAGGSSPDPDLHVITSQETWHEIARGGLAPLDAFGAGRLRLRGDTRLGVQVLKHLAGTPGRVEIC